MNDYVNNLEELASQLHDIARKLRAAGRNDLILSALGSSMLDELKSEEMPEPKKPSILDKWKKWLSDNMEMYNE